MERRRCGHYQDAWNNPQRTAIAASHTRPASASAQNTAEEPKSLILPMSRCCSGVTWSESFSIAVFKNSTASRTRSAAIMATYQARLGAMTKPIGTASTNAIASSRTAASVLTPSTIPRSEFLVALKIRFTARQEGLRGRTRPARVAVQDPADYSAAQYSERSAARLAHQSGGLRRIIELPSDNAGLS